MSPSLDDMLLVIAKAVLEDVCLTKTVHHANCVSTFQSLIHTCIKNILSQLSSKLDLHVDLSQTLLMSASLILGRFPELIFHELFNLIITNAREIHYFLVTNLYTI